MFDFPLRFPGQYADQETALKYNVFRDYDAAIGTYKESDPLGIRSASNLYTYASGNALSYADPAGLQIAPMGLGGAAATTSAASASAAAVGAIDNSSTASNAVGSNANIARGFSNLLNQIESSSADSNSSVPLPPGVSGQFGSCPTPPAANDPGPQDCIVRQQRLIKLFFDISAMQAQGIKPIRNVYIWYNQQAVVHNIVCRYYKVPVFNIGPTGSAP